jgi:hypothetical protein
MEKTAVSVWFEASAPAFVRENADPHRDWSDKAF